MSTQKVAISIAVLAALRLEEGEWITRDDIWAEAQKLGAVSAALNPLSTITTILSGHPDMESDGRGRWRWKGTQSYNIPEWQRVANLIKVHGLTLPPVHQAMSPYSQTDIDRIMGVVASTRDIAIATLEADIAALEKELQVTTQRLRDEITNREKEIAELDWQLGMTIFAMQQAVTALKALDGKGAMPEW